MRTLVRWDPFAEFSSLRRAMERAFDDYTPWHRGEELEMTFPIDVFDEEHHVVVKAVLPGIKAEDVDISVTGDALTIKGETKHEETVEKENYFRQEIRYGAFARMVPLPTTVRAEEAEAEFKDGVLTVKLPKAEETRPKKIRVRTRELAAAR